MEFLCSDKHNILLRFFNPMGEGAKAFQDANKPRKIKVLADEIQDGVHGLRDQIAFVDDRDVIF